MNPMSKRLARRHGTRYLIFMQTTSETDGPLLSVVIPVYNECDTIVEVVRRVQATPYRKEIILVDDAS